MPDETAPKTTQDGATAKRSRLTLWILLAVCVLPFAAALFMLLFAPPKSRVNYGELIEPHPLQEFSAPRLEGGQASLADLKGHWTMAMVDGADCQAVCQDKLYKMRQVRTAQGKNMDRVERLWIVSDAGAIAPEVLKNFAGTLILRAGDGRLVRQFPSAGEASGHIWIIDPLGNIMLRYPPQADPMGILKDLKRLLSVSQID